LLSPDLRTVARAALPRRHRPGPGAGPAPPAAAGGQLASPSRRGGLDGIGPFIPGVSRPLPPALSAPPANSVFVSSL